MSMRARPLHPARVRLRMALLAGAALLPAAARAADPLSEANRLMQAGDLQGARTQLLHAVQAQPRDGNAHYRLALLDMRMGDPAAAEHEADLARRSGFDVRESTALLLQAYLAEGKFRELLTDFPATGGPDAVRPTVLVARGLALLSLNRLDEAASTLVEAQRLAPKSPEPLLAQERLALARDDVAGARAKIDALLALDPDSMPGLDQKAFLLTQSGDMAGALLVLNGVLAKHPEDTNARLQRAGILLAQGKDREARADVDGVLSTTPNSAQAMFYRAVLLARAKDWKGADADLGRLAPVISRFPAAYFVQAIVKQQLGQFEQARDAAARFAARNPQNQQAAKLLASIDLQLHRPDLAITTLERFTGPVTPDTSGAAAVPSGPASAPAGGAASTSATTGQDSPDRADAGTLELLGRAYAMQGRTDLASAALRRATALGGSSPGLLNQLALSYLTMGEPGKAATSLQDSLRAAPNQPDVQQVLALAALQSGRVAEAQAALDRLRAQGAPAEATGNLAGLIATAQLDFQAARGDFEGVLKADPASVAAHVNLAHLDELENRPDDVRAQLAAVLAKDPANAQVLPLMVVQLQLHRQFSEAQKVLAAAHAASPADQAITASLADAAVRAGDPQTALSLTDGSDGRAPSLGMVTARAEAQLALHQDVAARQTYRDYVAANPRALPARLTLLRMLIAGGDFAGARSVVSDGLNITPTDPQLLGASVGVALKEKGFDAALARAKELAADPLHQPTSLALPGDLYALSNRAADAAVAYEAALREAPGSAVLAVQHARALDAAGQAAQAAQALHTFLAAHPDDPAALTLLGSIDITTHRLDDAAVVLRHLVNLRPTDAVALNNLAWVQQQQHQPDARSLAQRAYLVAPGAQTADTLGFILAQDGDARGAVPLLRSAHAQMPGDPAIAYHLAVALAGAGQPAEAQSLLGPLVHGTAAFGEKADAGRLLATLGGAH